MTQLWEGEQRFGVAVRLEESERTLTRMQGLLVATPDGAYVPLSEIANFRTVGGLMNIARENGKRVFAIGRVHPRPGHGQRGGRHAGQCKEERAAGRRLQRQLVGRIRKTRSAPMARLSVIVPISILIIFLLLFDAFKSFRNRC